MYIVYAVCSMQELAYDHIYRAMSTSMENLNGRINDVLSFPEETVRKVVMNLKFRAHKLVVQI